MPSVTFSDNNDLYTVLANDTFDLSFLGGIDTLTIKAAGTVTAHMGDGNDLVKIYGGIDTLYGDGGNDRFNIFSDMNNAMIDGGDGNDIFSANAHVIHGSIYGGAGADYFANFGAGASLFGGEGNDHYRIAANGLAPDIIERPNEGVDRVDVARGYSYTLPTNVEYLYAVNYVGSTGADATLTGNELDNRIFGNSNAETLQGLTGDDRLYGYGGNDTLYGGVGKDLLEGGNGNDTLFGGEGIDILRGGAGDDTLDGGDGKDALDGGAGNDTLIANAGGDRLVGGDGADTLIGGDGPDVFVFTAVSNSAVGASDTIMGYASTDRIDLHAIDADSSLAGDQAFSMVHSSTGSAGEAWTTNDGTYTHLFLDVDGGGADMEILVAGALNSHSNITW